MKGAIEMERIIIIIITLSTANSNYTHIVAKYAKFKFQ